MRSGFVAIAVLTTALTAGAARADCVGDDREFVFTDNGTVIGEHHEVCYGSQVNPIATAWHFWSNFF